MMDFPETGMWKTLQRLSSFLFRLRPWRGPQACTPPRAPVSPRPTSGSSDSLGLRRLQPHPGVSGSTAVPSSAPAWV